MKNSNGHCMAGYKWYAASGGSSAASETVIRQQVLQLAALLHEAPISNPALRGLQCTHGLEE